MSEMGSISGKLQREGEVLRELNDALLAVEADALGRSSDLVIPVKIFQKAVSFLWILLRVCARCLSNNRNQLTCNPLFTI